MVKKIGGIKGSSLTETHAVSPTKAVATTKVGGVGGVAPTERQSGVGKIRRPTRPMTAAEREHLMRLVHEEADRMFGPNGLPSAQRETLESAVRMTLEASTADEEEDS